MLALLLADEVETIKGFLNPDWSQFWPSIIATVVGFFLAIIFQQLIYEAIKDNMFAVSLISRRAIVAEHAMTADTTWIAP